MPAAGRRCGAARLITYTITVQNTGNTTLTGVTVTDPMRMRADVAAPTWR